VRCAAKNARVVNSTKGDSVWQTVLLAVRRLATLLKSGGVCNGNNLLMKNTQCVVGSDAPSHHALLA
jgi:hypothetical protein